MANIQTINKIKKHLRSGWIALSLTLIISIMAGGGVFMPDIESISSWVQRSGAIITVLSIIAYENSIEANSLINPQGVIGNNVIGEYQASYNKKNIWLKKFSVIFTIVGTIVWGYGDLLFKWGLSVSQ